TAALPDAALSTTLRAWTENGAGPAQSAAPSCTSPRPRIHLRTASRQSAPPESSRPATSDSVPPPERAHARRPPGSRPAHTPRSLRAADTPGCAHTRTRRPAPSSRPRYFRAESGRTHRYRSDQIAPEPSHLLRPRNRRARHFFLLQPLHHHGWHQRGDIATQLKHALDQPRADIRVLLRRHHEQRLELRVQLAVHHRHLEFILVIRDSADAADYGLRSLRARKVHQQSVEGLHRHIPEALRRFAQHLLALAHRE